MSDQLPSNITPQAREVFDLALNQAKEFGCDYIETEHLLLGIIRLWRERVAMNVLGRLGLDLDTVQTEVKKKVNTRPYESQPFKILISPRVNEVLYLADKASKDLGDTGIDLRHLLLGILEEGSGVAALVLKEMGVDYERTKQVILEG